VRSRDEIAAARAGAAERAVTLLAAAAAVLEASAPEPAIE
jgi:hypothetical protein